MYSKGLSSWHPLLIWSLSWPHMTAIYVSVCVFDHYRPHRLYFMKAFYPHEFDHIWLCTLHFGTRSLRNTYVRSIRVDPFLQLFFLGIVVASLKQGNEGVKYCQVENIVKSLRCHSRCFCCCFCWWFLPVIQRVPGASLFRRHPVKIHQKVNISIWFSKFFYANLEPKVKKPTWGAGTEYFF